jgi:hypothetical protein
VTADEAPAGVSDEVFHDHKRVWRTLVLLQR